VRFALESNPETQLKGVLWYQGESDADPVLSSTYLDQTIEFIQSLRDDLGAPTLPIICVQLGCYYVPQPISDRYELAWTEVREAQRQLPTILENVFTTSAIDLSLDDPIHLSTQSQKRLGKRLAHLALRQVYKVDAPGAIDFEKAWREGLTLKARFSGVNGSLKTPDPSGRAPGFAITNGPDGLSDPGQAFNVQITGPSEVTIKLANDIKPKSQLWYGYGLAPFCQLVDSEDMPAPAFGPIEV
jgi:sialate O-acetylesterase